MVCSGFVWPSDTYPPLRVGVKPNSVHRPTDMSRELRTVTTAARARPHLDFTMSIFPAGENTKPPSLGESKQLVHSQGQRFQSTISSTGSRGGI
uniref:Uncharacterized protein n=1 Tax=Sphenodon punctatus TaxID=8508 RepID=A0A8D0HWH7_SPHPU